MVRSRKKTNTSFSKLLAARFLLHAVHDVTGQPIEFKNQFCVRQHGILFKRLL
jgi:hypothetical protein